MNPKANHGLFAAITGALKPLNEGLRLIKTHEHESGESAKVYKDTEWGEHRVKFYDKEGKHLPDADYHTDDVEDAHGTAQAELKRSAARMNESADEPDHMDMAHDLLATHMEVGHAADVLHAMGHITADQHKSIKQDAHALYHQKAVKMAGGAHKLDYYKASATACFAMNKSLAANYERS